MMNNKLIDLTTLQTQLQCSQADALALLAQAIEDIDRQQLPDIGQAWYFCQQAPLGTEKKAAIDKLEGLVHRLKGNTCQGHFPLLNYSATLLDQFLKQCEGESSHEQTFLIRLYQQLRQDIEATLAAAKPLLSSHTESLQQFLTQWDADYDQQMQSIKLFDGARAKTWTAQQRQDFVYLFYHARGHFSSFLWLLGNTAPTPAVKTIILANFAEEFGGHAISHEASFADFAKAMGVHDIQSESLHGTHYSDALKQFNQGHLAWLAEHDWPMKWATFAAYERLDNMDYTQLLALVEALGVT
ncbi:MAG: iron-containing redox enzyme family protein [Gammaproteobacteria bacterium]|nr:iron-containing redox enzyme family protein [Gammaproteobacteria bacterium]